MFSAPIFFTSDANTASGAAVESMQFAWRGRKSACKFHCTIHRLKQCRRLGTTPSDLNSILCCCVVTISKLKSSPPLLVEGVYFTDEARRCRKMAAPRNKNTQSCLIIPWWRWQSAPHSSGSCERSVRQSWFGQAGQHQQKWHQPYLRKQENHFTDTF